MNNETKCDINKVQTDFKEVISLREDVDCIIRNLVNKVNTLERIYSDILKSDIYNNNDDKLFGIDAFNFQKNLINRQINDINGQTQMIDNRVYCEHYKLYNNVKEYVTNTLKNKTLIDKFLSEKNFPVYKNLEKKEYNFKQIISINNFICNVVIYINDYCNACEDDLQNQSLHVSQGLNINSMISSLSFENLIMRERNNLFISFLYTFNQHHNKYYSHLYIKCKLILGMLNQEIKIKQFNNEKQNDDSIINKLVDDNNINYIENENLEKELDVALEDLVEEIVEEDIDISRNKLNNILECKKTLENFIKIDDNNKPSLKLVCDTLLNNIKHNK